jgi:predicted unusual protein kinase regulating ubiquinone biosynthesis (AarF/ABC1/UbiB family)
MKVLSPLLYMFKSIDLDQVLGSGCIAQVYGGQLKDGTNVAVKVLHPNIRARVEVDLSLLNAGLNAFCFLFPSSVFLDLHQSSDAFCQQMREQLDLRIESENLLKFQMHFKKSAALVTFPTPLWSSRDCLVMEYKSGRVLSEVVNDPTVSEALKKEVAKKGLRIFFKMLKKNFVHGDLHAGNILVDTTTGAVSIVDAGLTVQLSADNKRNFYQLFNAVIARNGARCADSILERGGYRAGVTDETGFRRDMVNIFQRLNDRFNSGPLAQSLAQVLHAARSRRVYLDGSFVTLITSAIVLEGTGKRLDPNLNLFQLGRLTMKD